MPEEMPRLNQIVPQETNPYGIPWTDFFGMIQDKDLERYHKLGGLGGIARSLQTDLKDGIHRKTHRGEEVTYWKFLQEALSDRMMLLLLILGAVAVQPSSSPPYTEEDIPRSYAWIDGAFIIVAVMAKEMKFQALNARTSKIPFW
eukprot:gene37554-5060_t